MNRETGTGREKKGPKEVKNTAPLKGDQGIRGKSRLGNDDRRRDNGRRDDRCGDGGRRDDRCGDDRRRDDGCGDDRRRDVGRRNDRQTGAPAGDKIRTEYSGREKRSDKSEHWNGGKNVSGLENGGRGKRTGDTGEWTGGKNRGGSELNGRKRVSEPGKWAAERGGSESSQNRRGKHADKTERWGGSRSEGGSEKNDWGKPADKSRDWDGRKSGAGSEKNKWGQHTEKPEDWVSGRYRTGLEKNGRGQRPAKPEDLGGVKRKWETEPKNGKSRNLDKRNREWGNEEKRGAYAGRGSGKGRRLCPIVNLCGGCQLLDMEYSEQLKLKQRRIEELLKGLCPVKPIMGMKEPFHYRNKVHAVFDHDRRGNIITGIYQEKTHDVVPVEKCLIEDQKSDEIIGTIRGMLKSFKIRTYDEDTEFGLFRHVLIRRGFTTGEIMVVLVTASPIFPSKNNFVKALREKHPEITTIVQNINGRGTSMVLGDKEHVLYGKGYIVDELCGCRFRISSKSFYQVNPVQTEILYGKALALAGLTGKELVIDAYCGIGTIGIIASKQAGQVIGVELNKDAVRDAISNVKMNDIQNVRFFCNDAGRFMVNMAEQGEKADVVIMDPPRSGSTEEFMDAIGKLGAEKVIYVSCNPETLARDIKYMKTLGYRAVEAWPVDMFPETGNVETVVKLSRKIKD